MSSRRRAVAPVLWAVVVLLTSLPPLAAGYAAAWALPVLAGCVVLPFGVAALGRVVRVPRWTVATAGLVVGVVVALVFADRVDQQAGALPGWRSSPAFSVLGPLIDSVPRLLTAPRPAPADPSLLVPAALLVWLVALAVALAVVGTRRAGVAPLFGAVALHVAGGLLTAGRGDAFGMSALATAVALLLGWVLVSPTEPNAQASPTAPRPRRGVLLPALVTVVVATFALVAVAVPTARAFEPRTLVPPPQLPADATNPVPQSAVWAQSPGTSLLTIAPVEGELPERVSLAVLPDYSGVAWTLDAELRAVGVIDEPDTRPGLQTRTATYTLTADEFAEVWIPTAGRPTAVDGVPAVMDIDTGTLVAPSGWGAGAEVTVTSTITDPSDEALARASVPQAAEVTRYLELPRAPGHFAETARQVTSGVSSRWDQVSLLADWVRGDLDSGQERTLDHAARSGSSYERLTTFLFAEPDEGGQVGTTEQFASSFAVLARTIGIPTRLVVGFDVPDDAGAGPVGITGTSSRVWAEVYLSRVGWVPVDPSPDASITTDLPTPDAESDLGDDPSSDPTEDATADADVIQNDDGEEGASPAAAGSVALGLLAVAMLGVVGLAIARAARRRRWRSHGEEGAWGAVEDAMRLAGSPPAPGRTAPDLAASLPDDVSGSAVALAERAEARAYAPDDGPSADPHRSAWALAREVEMGLRRRAPWWRRLAWWISPRVWRR